MCGGFSHGLSCDHEAFFIIESHFRRQHIPQRDGERRNGKARFRQSMRHCSEFRPCLPLSTVATAISFPRIWDTFQASMVLDSRRSKGHVVQSRVWWPNTSVNMCVCKCVCVWTAEVEGDLGSVTSHQYGYKVRREVVSPTVRTAGRFLK